MADGILIVDEAATNRKLTQRVLAAAGYDVRAVPDAIAALAAIPEFRPRLVLTDLRLAGMDGLALTRRIKSDPQTRAILVIAVTGCDAEDDRRAAQLAGCDDFISKPIDTRALPAVIQHHLDRQTELLPLPPAPPATPQIPDWAQGLCREFVLEGAARSSYFAGQNGSADPAELRRAAHVWAGLGGTLGYPEITAAARDLENGSPASLQKVSALFATAAEPFERCDGSGALAGKRIALEQLSIAASSRIRAVIERAGAQVVPAAPYDLLVAGSAVDAEPVLYLADGAPQKLAPRADFLSPLWTAPELVARASRLLTQPLAGSARAVASNDRKWRVVIADDDPTILTLLRTTIENSGMECATAGEGDEALRLIRSLPADAVILDIMMPNMDGLEVLAALRNDGEIAHLPVLVLSALQQETDIVRAFGLGADDYVTKPFSPMEVIARLKRLRRVAA